MKLVQSLACQLSTAKKRQEELEEENLLINGKTYTYEDGKLKLMGSGYLKAGETSHTPSWQDDTWYPDWTPKDENPGDFQPEIESQVELKDLADRKAIEARTGLADRAWTEDPTNNVFINHDVLYDIVNAAERLAKRCLWAWVRTHRPDFNMGYLSDLDFGRQALHSWINRLPFDFFDCRHTRSYEVTTKLNELVTLRNFLHHFNGRCCSVYKMDSTLQTVQELAVLLYDEDSAVHARALRDRLRQEAERTVKEFETYMLLSALPESQQTWKPHHVALVEVAAREINYKATLGAEMEYESALEPSSLPPVALATARDWMAKPAGWNYRVAQPEAPSWA
ncbi:hypothetical protein Daus18300_014062 [Diaporthe australafricana]|uniref:Uncharacterized protein n=1 Tax=Diaporthe australafricana TaxID=127596 RepID=A0ABR3VWP1_9PEZI